MKAHDLKGLDQIEVATLCEQLKLHAANLRGLIHTKTGQLVSAPSLSAPSLLGGDIENLRTLEAHCTEIQAQLGDSAPAFQFSAARFVVHKTGVASGRLPAPAEKSSAASAKKPSLTEKVLAARGSKSLDELAARHAVSPFDKNS
jgi:hypothetical protein